MSSCHFVRALKFTDTVRLAELTRHVVRFEHAQPDQPDVRGRLLWWLVALTGLRRGEVAAPRWRDVDLDAGTLTPVKAG